MNSSYLKNLKKIVCSYFPKKNNEDNNDEVSFDCVYSMKSSESESSLSSLRYLSSPTGFSNSRISRNNDMSLVSISSSEESISSIDSQENLCCICLQDIKESKSLFMTYCHHKFHVKCVKQWLIEKSTCPLCNSNQEKLKNRLSL